MGHRLAIILGSVWLLGIAAAAAGNQPVPDYGYQWATIGDVGNPDTVVGQPFMPPNPTGGVDYEYRISKTEVSVAQWYEFVLAYQPYYTGPRNDTAFIGDYIQPVGGVTWFIADNPDRATNMSWEWAARYCNWLHNGKALTREAFESGAYDTSTFTRNPDGTYNHQLTRSAGARFWIPSVDEWVKAAYWDPNKNGDGQGGYWRYPTTSDLAPISGPPGLGGQTNAGPNGGPVEVGAYPSVTSPWGLFDLSGGQSEWTETGQGNRRVRGSAFDNDTVGFAALDEIANPRNSLAIVVLGGQGLRLASAVPSPSASILLLLFPLTFKRRSR